MRSARIIVALALCAMVLIAETPRNSMASTRAAASFMGIPAQSRNLRLLKVHMGDRTLWSDGLYYHYEIAAAAEQAGYDAVFFADNALQFSNFGKLADPNFEDTNQAGNFTRWEYNVTGPFNKIAKVEPLNLHSLAPFTYPQLYAPLARVMYGSHTNTVFLAIQSSSNSSRNAGRAYVTDMFPSGYIFNNTSIPPTRPYLFNGLGFSAYVFFDTLGFATQMSTNYHNGTGYIYPDKGWFYVTFYLTNPSPVGLRWPLTVTVIYSDHPVDNYLRRLRGPFLNTTRTMVIYQNIPPLQTWVHINFNVTGLALELWNQTVADYWRLGGFEIGTWSTYGALVDAYVDDVSIYAANTMSPLQYFKEQLQNELSTDNFKVYSGYTVYEPGLPSPYVYGTTWLNLDEGYNLTDPAFWDRISNGASANDGVVMMGSVAGLQDYVTSTQAFGVPIIDGTSYDAIAIASALAAHGIRIVFAATRKAVLVDAYNSTSPFSNFNWSMRVLALSDSETDILDAIRAGRDYLALSNFNGTFEDTGFGFPRGQNPIYVPQGQNASLSISFSGLSPGYLHVEESGGYFVSIPHNGSESVVVSARLTGQAASFITWFTRTNETGLLTIVDNPLIFAQTSMIPGGALFIDNDDWSVQSSEWATGELGQQQMRVVVQGPTDSEAEVYLYSPQYRPNATSLEYVVRSVTVDGVAVDPMSVYNTTKSTFMLPVKSAGKPVVIVLDFSVPASLYWSESFQWLVGLYALIALPFAFVLLNEALRRHKRRTT